MEAAPALPMTYRFAAFGVWGLVTLDEDCVQLNMQGYNGSWEQKCPLEQLCPRFYWIKAISGWYINACLLVAFLSCVGTLTLLKQLYIGGSFWPAILALPVAILLAIWLYVRRNTQWIVFDIAGSRGIFQYTLQGPDQSQCAAFTRALVDAIQRKRGDQQPLTSAQDRLLETSDVKFVYAFAAFPVQGRVELQNGRIFMQCTRSTLHTFEYEMDVSQLVANYHTSAVTGADFLARNGMVIIGAIWGIAVLIPPFEWKATIPWLLFVVVFLPAMRYLQDRNKCEWIHFPSKDGGHGLSFLRQRSSRKECDAFIEQLVKAIREESAIG